MVARLRDLAASLSLANLMFLRLWLKLLPYRGGSDYLLPSSPYNSYLALMLNVTMWGVIFFCLFRVTKGSRTLNSWLHVILVPLVAVAALYGVGISRISLARFAFFYGPHSVLFLEIACWLSTLTAVYVVARYREVLARFLSVLPLLFVPFLPVTFGQAAAALAAIEPPARFHPHRIDPPAPLVDRIGIPVVWAIFDETDYRILFEKRPPGLAFPAFDKFRENALWATQAYSPSDATLVSLPALLTGIPLKTTTPLGARRLELVRANDGTRLDFAAQETIFDRVKKRQGSTALFGWYHPYSRLLHGVDLCRDYPRYNFFTSDRLRDVLLFQLYEVWDFRFLPFSNTILGNNHIRIVERMRSDVAAAVRKERPSFIFLHYPLPHSPNIYQRGSGRLAFNRDERQGYLDNMTLADRCLEELRAEMEREGTWDGALVVISSDHHWRTNTYDGETDYEHVPFMVKFPHQREGLTYRGRFNTVLTQELILRVLDGKLKGAQEAADWLDRAHRKNADGKVLFSVNQPDDD
ncbi:sulfatase-like hydrolase/transferase [Geobacter pickeringii]|uniref:Sulfatase N-terminal domain-containing protein n=1 Tax=Geobacter pickeringii TaxID=345632 RepID=A0A0B5B7T9_9BACT|nr:sulfatase-like hydrolase/transferase [Geobacter pickeringii]AJE02608.1 hypothetical protein GPICK_03785 [Geobacter pickeringii]